MAVVSNEMLAELKAALDAEDFSTYYARLIALAEVDIAEEWEIGAGPGELEATWYHSARQVITDPESSVHGMLMGYTRNQIELRLNATISDAQLLQLSAALAEAIYDSIEIDGRTPSIAEITRIDNDTIVEGLQRMDFAVNDEVWSGNLFMVALGQDVPLTGSLLHGDIGEGDPAGTYDMMAALEAMRGTGAATLGGAFGSAAWATGNVTGANALSAMWTVADYFADNYGISGAARWLDLLSAMVPGDNIRVGSTFSDDGSESAVMVLPSGNVYGMLLHGGAGNDVFEVLGTVMGSFSVIDGGTDLDTVDFSQEAAGQVDWRVTLYDLWGDGAAGQPFSARAYSLVSSNMLYNVEQIVLGAGADHVRLVGTPEDVRSDLQMIDAGDGVDYLDLSAFSANELEVFLEENYWGFGAVVRDVGGAADEYWQLSVRNFDNVRGSEGDDRIEGSSGQGNLGDNPGANTIDGGAGDDVIDGLYGDDVLFGGAGNDTIYDGYGNDVLLGGDGNDWIWASSESTGGGIGGPVLEGYVLLDDMGGGLSGDVTPGYDIVDGGAGEDTLSVSGTVYGDGNGNLVLSDGEEITDILLNFEVIENATTLDMSSNTVGFTYDGGTTISTASWSVEFPDLTRINGSQGNDNLTASEQVRTLFGGDGDDILNGGTIENANLTGGRGNDQITGGEGASADGGDGNDVISIASGGASGGDGNDVITVAGAGSMSGGAGADVMSGGIGSAASGDAQDTLSIGGISITGNGAMFGADGWYPEGSQARANLLARDWVLMVRPALIQFYFDGTQASVAWEGRLVTNIGGDMFDDFDRFTGETAGRVYFNMGDFGLQTARLEGYHGLGVYYITHTDPETGETTYPTILNLPLGNLTGSDTESWPDSYGNVDLTMGTGFNLADASFAGFEVTAPDLDVDLPAVSGDQSVPPSAPNPYSDDDLPTDILLVSNTVQEVTEGKTYQGFDPADGGVLLMGGAILSPAGGAGYNVAQVGGDVQITLADGGTVTLAGVDLAAWQMAAASQVTGGAGGDTLQGGSSANVIAGGAGDDVIAAGAGDDVIRYFAGDDVIYGASSTNLNTGVDTLDLSRYDAADVQFRNEGFDILIETPDGTIRLEYETRYATGHVHGNIEVVQFADGVLDEAAIRMRALVDQASAGDDRVTGTVLEDVIAAGTGNDTIVAGRGDDVIVYGGGDDLIRGDTQAVNGGADVLDLSGYAAPDLVFDVSGHDLLIATPDGVITVEYQLRYEESDTRSNIETIVMADAVLEGTAAIHARALADQAGAGDDLVQGTIQSDIFHDTQGDDTLVGGGGDDVFVFLAGNDAIGGSNDHAVNGGFDRLDLSAYAAGDLLFDVSGFDVRITTPDGVITLDYQLRYDEGHARGNIEQIITADGVLDAQAIHARALSDQASARAEAITGSTLGDVLVSGAGDDTLRGNGGADLFVFMQGDGNDLVTDFALGVDHLAIEAANFAALSIVQIGADTQIDYGAGDRVTLLAVDPASLGADHFDFL